MLSRLYRLTKQGDFKHLYSTGKSVNGRRLRLKVVANGLPHTRIGVVVANSVSKRATARNQIKRWIREVVRKELPRLRSGMDLVISANVSAASASYQDIQGEIAWLLQRAKLMI